MANAQVRVIEADTAEALETRVNEFLQTIGLAQLMDVQYYTRGIWLGVFIIYQEA